MTSALVDVPGALRSVRARAGAERSDDGLRSKASHAVNGANIMTSKVENTSAKEAQMSNVDDVEAWLIVRKEEALKIDPETAEVFGTWGEILDPYGVRNLPEDLRCYGGNNFVRRPGGDIWVWDGDLPKDVRDRLWKRVRENGAKTPDDDFFLF